MPADEITVADIDDAAARIQGLVCRTPLRLSPSLSRHSGYEVRLKLETMQDTGAFKIRGATNALLQLSETARQRGVLGVSTGNHGRGVAFAAKRLNIPCSIYMSSLVPTVKVEAIRDLGAEVIIHGKSQDEAEVAAMAKIAQDGLTYIHPFDHAPVIAGQGTIGREIIEDMPNVATIVVPLSGGGLIAGTALAAKAANPDIRIIGVSMDRGAAMAASLKAGHFLQVEEVETLADSLGGGIGENNRFTLDMCRRLVDQVVLLSEDEIADAIRALFFDDGLVAEGGGAVGVGALITQKADLADGPVAVVVSGGNIDRRKLLRILST